MKVVAVFVALLQTLVLSAGQKPCCAPKQFMAGNGAVVGQADPSAGPEGYYVYEYGAFDYTNRQFGFNMTVTYPNGTSSTVRLIQKYAKNSQWVILDKLKICLKQPATEPEPISCIPDNATLTDSMIIGGPGGLSVDNWAFPYGYPLDGQLSMSVTRGKCYPVGTNFVGVRYDGATQIPMVSSGGILNMTLGIPDPDTWFNLPSFCTSQQSNAIRSSQALSGFNLEFLHFPRFL